MHSALVPAAYASSVCAVTLRPETLSGICHIILRMNNMCFDTLQCIHRVNKVLCKVLDATFCTHITSV